MSARRDAARDFLDMQLHRLGVSLRQRERGAFSERRADRSEEISVFVALIGWLARPRALACPLTHETVLLADARLVLT
jgi:hypothetical protein